MSDDRAVDSFLALSTTRLAPRTVDAYRRDLVDVAVFLGGSPEKATPDRLAAYVASMRARGLAATTIARRIAALRSFYRHQMLIGARKAVLACGNPSCRREKAVSEVGGFRSKQSNGGIVGCVPAI